MNHTLNMWNRLKLDKNIENRKAETYCNGLQKPISSRHRWYYNVFPEVNKESVLHKKWSFSLRISPVNVTKCSADLVTFTEEILSEKLHFLCSIFWKNLQNSQQNTCNWGILYMFGSSVVPFLGVFYKKSRDKQLYNSVGRNTRFHQPISTIVPLLYPWKHQKTGGFQVFSGGIEVEHWLKMGYLLAM